MKSIEFVITFTHWQVLVDGLALVRKKEAALLHRMLLDAFAVCRTPDTGLMVRASKRDLLIYKEAVVRYVGKINHQTVAAQQLFVSLAKACLSMETQRKAPKLTVRSVVQLLSSAGIPVDSWDKNGDTIQESGGVITIDKKLSLHIDNDGVCYGIIEDKGSVVYSQPFDTPNALVTQVTFVYQSLNKGV